MANQIVWFDIPAVDLDRAIRFYSAVLGQSIHKEEFPGGGMGVLPHEGGEVGGCIFASEGVTPSDKGPLIYFNASGRLDEAMAAVEPSGGKVLEPKHSIGPHGFRGIVLDSEGNRVALHSM
jgi:predicted enzyme related to lactoylglutathione lyase